MPKLARIVAALVLVPTVLGAARFFGTTTTRQYRLGFFGVSYAGSMTQTNDNGDQNKSELCKVTCGEIACSVCHTGGRDRTKETYTVANHDKTYYPRAAVPPKEGYRVQWGGEGGFVAFKNNRYTYLLKDGTLNMTAPAGTLFLRDRNGAPFMLWMPAAPTIAK